MSATTRDFNLHAPPTPRLFILLTSQVYLETILVSSNLDPYRVLLKYVYKILFDLDIWDNVWILFFIQVT